MEETFKQCFRKSFGAAIDMLKQAVALCPDELWRQEKRFFYIAYHTTIFLDYYLTVPAANFQPALPYTLTDADKLPPEAVDDVMPNEHYSREAVMAYLASIREKCNTVITLTPPDRFNERWISDEEAQLHGLCPSTAMHYTLLEILFYNFRHVQHHAGQLNFILRQKINTAPDWISQV